MTGGHGTVECALHHGGEETLACPGLTSDRRNDRCASRRRAQLKFFRNSLSVPWVSSEETRPESEQTLTKPTRRSVPRVKADPKTVSADEPRSMSVSMTTVLANAVPEAAPSLFLHHASLEGDPDRLHAARAWMEEEIIASEGVISYLFQPIHVLPNPGLVALRSATGGVRDGCERL